MALVNLRGNLDVFMFYFIPIISVRMGLVLPDI